MATRHADGLTCRLRAVGRSKSLGRTRHHPVRSRNACGRAARARRQQPDPPLSRLPGGQPSRAGRPFARRLRERPGSADVPTGGPHCGLSCFERLRCFKRLSVRGGGVLPTATVRRRPTPSRAVAIGREGLAEERRRARVRGAPPEATTFQPRYRGPIRVCASIPVIVVVVYVSASTRLP
jgi:hypothetical protein